MRRIVLAIAATTGAALTGAILATPSAHAATGDSRFTVSVRHGDAPAQTATLLCRPAGGTHEKAQLACRTLVAANGDPRAIPAADIMCTADYAPVTAKLTGIWRGTTVRYQRTFGNACVMKMHTGPLFDL